MRLQQQNKGVVLILGVRYISELSGGKLTHRMDHLACFWPGTLALASMSLMDAAADNADAAAAADAYLNLAQRIGSTCARLALESPSGLAPESVTFIPNAAPAEPQFTVTKPGYHLRPEILESMFYLWRATKDHKCVAPLRPCIFVTFCACTASGVRTFGAQLPLSAARARRMCPLPPPRNHDHPRHGHPVVRH
jgi:hypothetical protein